MRKVVIVDDTKAAGQPLEALIKAVPNVAVRVFTHPLEALVWCDENEPDLVLLDSVMPDVDGVEFLRRFRSLPQLRDVPVIMIAGEESRDAFYIALHAGATDFLRRPVDRIELNARARNMLEMRCRQLDLLAAKKQLLTLSTTDAITGLKNRRAFLEAVEAELDRSRRYKRSFTVAAIDIDYFKEVNDVHGHDVGDMVLQALGFICADEFRTVDQIGRVGGEEFAVLFAELPVEGALKACNRLLTRVRGALIPAGGVEFACTVSIGVSDAGREDDSVIAIMKRADAALHSAKCNGRDRIEIAESAAPAEVPAEA